MDKNLFSELQDLGFDDIENIDLFNTSQKETPSKIEINADSKEKEKSLLYDREIICPICENKFLAKAVKKEGYKVQKRDSDSFVHYALVNPYFYDVWVCNKCGYSAMISDFHKIKPYQIPLIIKNITPRWHGKNYPDTYDVKIAIERYKLALLNYFYLNIAASRKAMTCLRLAWMYRIQKDTENEMIFMKQAIEGFENAYFNEGFPILGMDKFSIIYLLGELNRRVGNYEKALSWFSQVMLPPEAPRKLKEKVRDQKDLIDAVRAVESESIAAIDDQTQDVSHNKKEGLFSKIFKR